MLRLFALLLVLGGGGITALIATRRPRADRTWAIDHARAPTVSFADSLVRVEGVRRFRYPAGTGVEEHWETATYDLSALSSVWLVLTPFSKGWRGPAHTFVSFGFGDSSYVAISIEARREADEEYGVLRGLGRNYELIYVVGDEPDLIGRRVAFDEADTYLYPLTATPADARAMFTAMLKRAAELQRTPEFYNTLSNSCVSNLVEHVNRLAPGRIPGGVRLLFPGYADAVAHELGLIDATIPIDSARARYRINDRARGHLDAPDFSRRIRQ
jgi:hypothetical protein